jgi:dTMP kinase
MDFSGKFIVLDGPDGCGKSTQAEMLRKWIASQGAEVVSFRDPGGTEIGEKIREILLDATNHKMGVRAELLLYMASRAQLWHECIEPALNGGKCVVMDRWLSSTCAYQGYAGGAGIETVIKIAETSLERVWPDAIIVLDVDLATAAKRMQRQLDRMELKGDVYHEKVRQGFLKLAEFADCVDVVDARQGIEAVHKDVIEIIERRISHK